MARARKANRVHDEELKQASEKAFAASAAVAASTVTDPLFWERVCQLCDFFCPSGTTCSSGDGDSKGMNGYPNTMLGFIRSPGKESKDLNRMRSLLLQLKQTPINAKR
ncbi:unnamed protein product [Protopolystoma xenopodis]|uniref:Clathrin light chain n=1 Tax=Protopolystoma xenopodis TaxID=117903 RepID=A0A448XNF9_9PLAT|nr:unnamed protein product [Protopolystoma xenopodis]